MTQRPAPLIRMLMFTPLCLFGNHQPGFLLPLSSPRFCMGLLSLGLVWSGSPALADAGGVSAPGVTAQGYESPAVEVPAPSGCAEAVNATDVCPPTLLSQATPDTAPSTPPAPPETPFELDPAVIESSPVLQDWLRQTPDIAAEIQHDPSFRTRLRLGYSQFPSTGQAGGINLGVEDIFVWPGTGLTVSGDYARSWNDTREAYGAEARYYLLPLGGYVNVAPVVGYRHLETPLYTTDGVNVGFRLMIVPSRGGAADFSISQTWVAPGTAEEVGITGFSGGYAITHHLRLATDLQFQNSRFGQDSRLGISLEWLL